MSWAFLVPTRFGFNESKHPWMDEGFTTYVSDLAENEFATKKVANPSKEIIERIIV
jgi:hypothetical protein